MVYELTDLKRLINCELIDCIELSNKDLSKKIVYNFIDFKTKYDLKTALTKTYFINTFNGQNNGSNNLANNLFEDKKNPIITLDDTNQIDKSEYLIFFINKNNITKKDINLINKYISLYSSKVLGWYFLQNT